MSSRKYRYFVGDFETTVYDNQQYTEVWASACVELFTEDVKIFNSIDEQYNYFVSLNSNIVCYYHNLKFDGNFWLAFLLQKEELKQALINEGTMQAKFLDRTKMQNGTFTYSISSMGQWYRIIIKINNKIIELRDSLKLLPFSVKKIGEDFKTKHQKLDMEYKGFRYAGCVITDEEKEYIKNDVLVVKEALEIMFDEGHKRLTIGSCCLNEYKEIIGRKAYKEMFPNLYEYKIDEELYGYDNAGDYIRQSYHGGWCYVAKGKERKEYKNGTTLDVNSLYPSMMSAESGNKYPYGLPTFWKGDIPLEAFGADKFYFVRFRTRFYIKKDRLPFIQIKNNLAYKSTEMLETSDMYNSKTGYYSASYVDFDGEVKPATLTLTMTMMDFKLFREQYKVKNFEILDGCYFNCCIGIFDEYIEKYKKIKMESKGAKREISKLFLNNLYGKMASSTHSNYKVAYIKDDNTIGFYTVVANDKVPGYIAVGSAITSYARNFTIRVAQANYYGKEKRGFIYADTDSIHCDLEPNEIKGVTIDDKQFCCWKMETNWDYGYFVRQKTYVERVVKENGKEIDEPYYNLKCAGMSEKCKNLFLKSIGVDIDLDFELTEDEKEFISQKRTIKDFDLGLTIPGKLMPRRIRGGVVLVDTTYQMR